VTFSEPVIPASFTSGDVIITGATPYSVAITDSGDHIHFTASVSGIPNARTIVATIPVNTVSDLAGNFSLASTSTDNTVTYNDTASPSVTVEQAVGQPDPTSASIIHFTATFNEPINISSFISSDVTLGGTAGANLVAITQLAPNNGTKFDLAVSGMTLNGDVTASIPAGNVNDLVGNPNNASTSVDNTVTFDNALPSVTVEQAAGQADPTGNSPINFTATFSQPINTSTFNASDITLSGSAGPTTAVISEIAPNDGTTFNIAVSGMTGSGSVTASIAMNTVQDLTGKGNTSSTSTDNTVTYDMTSPTVRVEQAASQADPTTVSPIEFIATFSEPIDKSTFTALDITLGGSANPATAVITEVAPNNGTTFSVKVSGMTSNGLVTASIGAGKVTDVPGNLNSASTSVDNSVTYDAVLPNVTVEQAAGQADPTAGSPINFTATFSKPIDPSTFTSDDVTLTGSAGATTVVLTEIAPNNGTKFNIQVSGMTGSGTVIALIAANKIQDPLGNANTASTSVDNSVTYDISTPVVTVEQAASQADPTSGSPIVFTITFSKPITGFNAGMVTIGGTAGASSILVNEIAPNNGTTFEAIVSGMTSSGTVTASVPANVVKDAVGNFNNASTSADNTVTYDLQAPSVISTSLQAAYTDSGPSSFTVTFSEEVYDPAGNTDTDDVTNPNNYLLVEKGANGVIDTLSCKGGLRGDDIKVNVSSVAYSNPNASVSLIAPVPFGSYRLFICGTTSITDLALTPIIGGLSDFTFDFTVSPRSIDTTDEAGSGKNHFASFLPKTGFAPSTVTSLPQQPADLIYADLGDMWLEIPALNINTSIVGVPQSEDAWDVKWLGNDAGWLNGTAYPTWEGNSVITGHVYGADGLPGIFVGLKDLRKGDQVIVHMGGEKYIFEVKTSKLVRPETTAFAFEHLEKNSYLTLITCAGYNEQSGSYRFRRVVRAVLVDVQSE
jgi:LPXTG-site transpeptidase (sortase) family protein